MKIIEQSARLISMTPEPLKVIEEAGRTAYNSRDKICEGSAAGFVGRIIRRKHLSVLEFADATFEFTTSRGIADELRTHRICSHIMRSTRYCDMADGVEFVRPVWATPESLQAYSGEHSRLYAYDHWIRAMNKAEMSYGSLRSCGLPPEHARGVLPLDLATVMVTKANFRQWLEIFRLRCDKAAHPAMRELMGMAKDILAKEVPEVFGEAL